jgi:hypothetical protein
VSVVVKESTPEPTGKGVALQPQPSFTIYVWPYGGFSNEKIATAEAAKLGAALSGADVPYYGGYFLTAAYDSPFNIHKRHNEVWFAAKKERNQTTNFDGGRNDQPPIF